MHILFIVKPLLILIYTHTLYHEAKSNRVYAHTLYHEVKPNRDLYTYFLS